jgi:type IV pilus biogenesis protein PilP
MSRPARSFVVRRTLPALCALVLASAGAPAQTIADYSRAQRALLESAMSQAAARSSGLGASTPAPAVSPVGATVRPTRTPMPMPMPLASLAPAVQVTGIFAASGGTVAEVMVNATPYLLGPGQGVPGTAWHVESIALDRVVLGRPGADSAADAEGTRKVFPLPALR